MKQREAKLLAILAVFETGRAQKGFSKVAVLNDGAGVSYGFLQFTHRSGSLRRVLEEFQRLGGAGGEGLKMLLELTADRSEAARQRLAGNKQLLEELAAAGKTRQMKIAQIKTAKELYLEPAIKAAEKLGFKEELSLAVIFDSMVHGGWQIVSSRVKTDTEKVWIKRYLIMRDNWLGKNRLLSKTRYRTRFFLGEIEKDNWDLKLPLEIGKARITEAAVNRFLSAEAPEVTPLTPQNTAQHQPTADEKRISPTPEPRPTEISAESGSEKSGTEEKSEMAEKNEVAEKREVTEKNGLEEEGERDFAEEAKVNGKAEDFFGGLKTAAQKGAGIFDSVESATQGIINRTDRAKSLWTTVYAACFQTFWAVLGWLAAVPKEIWIITALILAALAILYLYRQIELGKIREQKNRE